MNGNIVTEQDSEIGEESEPVARQAAEKNGVYSQDYGWALTKDGDGTKANENNVYSRTYEWDSRNELVQSSDQSYTTVYVYGDDGQRTNKMSNDGETMYFSKMYTWRLDSGDSGAGVYCKHIFLGDTRIVTKLRKAGDTSDVSENYSQYYYHSDHLGSAELITDYQGSEYQWIEYTPYGETWVEKKGDGNYGTQYLPYTFTGKEQDKETGLYYYGARYLDPKYSRWISCDPALGEYIPVAPTNDEAKKHNSNLPGNGGVFNAINLHLYHYAGNNPVRYTDPDGTKERSDIENLIMMMNDGKSTGKECFNEAENIAAKEAKVGMQEIPAAMEEGLLGGMKIMTDHGAEISLLCYASGQIELGGIIDGVSFACDITSAYHEYKETGDAKKFTKEATKSLAFTLVGNGCSNAITKNVLKNFKLSSKEFKNFVESSSNIIVGLLSLDVSKLQE